MTEQSMTKQMTNMKPPTHKQRKTATEELPWIGQKENYWALKLVLLAQKPHP